MLDFFFTLMELVSQDYLFLFSGMALVSLGLLDRWRGRQDFDPVLILPPRRPIRRVLRPKGPSDPRKTETGL